MTPSPSTVSKQKRHAQGRCLGCPSGTKKGRWYCWRCRQSRALAARALEDAAVPVQTMCPKCESRPSRRPMAYRGMRPLCVECYAQSQTRHAAQSGACKRAKRRGETPPRRDPKPRGRPAMYDISEAEIERRFLQAKQQIRARQRGVSEAA